MITWPFLRIFPFFPYSLLILVLLSFLEESSCAFFPKADKTEGEDEDGGFAWEKGGIYNLFLPF